VPHPHLEHLDGFRHKLPENRLNALIGVTVVPPIVGWSNRVVVTLRKTVRIDRRQGAREPASARMGQAL
jgi:hypothetical protein